MTTNNTKTWICTVCGYIHQGDDPPDCCPVCGALPSDFEPHETEALEQPEAPASQWRCINCNYVHDGSQAPEICPICGALPDRFEAVVQAEAGGHAEEAVRIVVIGGGIAGVSAAEAAREAAPRSEVTILCQEPVPPYYRLNLTRYLAREIDRDSLSVHEAAWYEEQGINLRVGVLVIGLALDSKQVELESGEMIDYDKLVLAMGSHAFVPPLPGADLNGVTSLRTSQDAEVILDLVKQDGRCIVIGGGILGLETAGALGKQGAEVTLIESHDWLMPRQLNSKAAEILEGHMAGLGVTVKKQARTRCITGDDHATGIELEGGEIIEAGAVILATGVRPNTALARKAGLEINRGIVVNNSLRTSDGNVYAAGDVAEHNGQLYGAWSPSQYQGKIAGLNACGVLSEFGGLPRANALKVLGIDMLSIGKFEPEDGSYQVLDIEDNGKLAHFVFHDGRIVGAILMGYPELGTRVKKAVEERMDFSGVLISAESGRDIIDHLEK